MTTIDTPRILVALSLAEGRDAAFERALALARVSGAELYLLHAVPADRPFGYRAAERLSHATRLRQRAEDAGVRARTVEQHGDPAEVILLHADARDADLIVLGAERRRSWLPWGRRPVAERVLRATARPTLVVRADDTGDPAAFADVLVAVDTSDAATPVIEAAMRMPAEGRRRVTVLHAATSIEPYGNAHNRARWLVPEFRRYVLEAARRRLAAVAPHDADDDVTVQLHVAGGDAAEAIADHAAAVDAGLVVVGRSPRRLRRGSTVVRLLRETDRALLLVPPVVMPLGPDTASAPPRRQAPAAGDAWRVPIRVAP